ncbi:hypothetical protein [Marinoscillum sp. MHG1-6]|uniref:hypothetical protein n=1 Tax=Marinoscillum sp. MHG1-6 TaxID=2959627 RepID=UPI00215770E6|nr:hypothetical protein [Marinoscillum sp. MHG1-6]
MKYQKTQFGWFVVLSFVPIMAFLYLSHIYQWGDHPIPDRAYTILSALFFVICLLFYKLTIKLDGLSLILIYGIGIIQIKFRLDKVERVDIIKTPWYYGLGIRITPKGMLYNIQGSKALRIVYLRDGKRKSVMVGTPEPERLKGALEALNDKMTA